FFEAEAGIRDSSVTGVQTCALPISKLAQRSLRRPSAFRLQRSPASEVASVNFTPVASAEKARVTGHPWATQAQIDADGNAGVGEIGRASGRERGEGEGGRVRRRGKK